MTMDSRQILKRHGRSFHFASLFLSAGHRDRAADLYAFCRQVDDIADEAADKNKAWDELETIKTGLSKGANGASRNGTSRAAYDLVATVQSDLRTVDLQTQDDLIQYAYGVAGTVGLLMCDVLGVHDARAKSYAIDLGIGMQLTNIARDVQADAHWASIPAHELDEKPKHWWLGASWTKGTIANRAGYQAAAGLAGSILR